ncbi:uncharacterized protein LOC123442941 [Hordeum vulgare subsp. vulgare]|uniref:Predicted protein n=1 Tax=Hordeum vulgare subsp. vulgare TaxID=112509 RepID=F2CX90_HORVV|nr:uncharacterized protein LOC123442941 [Hordeum vulgare subsp. vulgare]KAI5005288.1 hypothetical protein ZWY2020_032531 [Hordeum vulgare]BAJ87461.1 predicted protein [Hordeum vulgare subsp. vulgare]BAJ94824.1 predicted protein [Hordeum vulgare subsp. vulgare]
MEATATSYPVARDAPPRPAPQTAQLGGGPAPQSGGWARWALWTVVFLVLTASFAWGVYQSRHRPRSLAFVIATYYLLAVLYCCLGKLSLLRRDDPAAAPERRRVRLAVWVVSVAFANVIAARVADSMEDRWLRIAVWVILAVGIGVGFYFFFIREGARDREVAGRRQETELHQVSPEQRV